eukprot:CAMPEP_0119302894 /NCGR_PEP_ID=MMETSP1333-20130426/4407_1 /TAXON_ID=418940 /ORGANISM="Scyphosphaera apsteinii, Strain RCC1455" /LENGTH=681 /DNA_ID=CAMNT_0007305391 /DNA_START=22 /DNA_END=2067 /DNA_ORIENTATION=-
MSSILPASRKLACQLRIVFADLQANYPNAVNGVTGATQILPFARKYVAEMYIAATELRQEASIAREDSEEVDAELQRTLWASCIWELSVLVLIQRPVVLGELLVPWWQRHLSDRRTEESELPMLLASEEPHLLLTYWPTLRTLLALGRDQQALQLVQCHPALQEAPSGAGMRVMQQLLLRLETLIEQFPRLSDPDLFQPQLEEVALGQRSQAVLAVFQHQWRQWRLDLGELARDAASAAQSDRSAAEIYETASLLSGEDAAITAAVGTEWHAVLLAKLLLQQPTRLRWQVADLVRELVPPLHSLDAFQRALTGILSDDPYAAVQAIREAYGDGWLVAHLWDLLCRVSRVQVDQMQDSDLDFRQYLLLQYAKALGGCGPLWQLAVEYASDLVHPPSSCEPAREWIGQLLRGQPLLHSVKVRKLLQQCERHGLHQTAQLIISQWSQRGQEVPASKTNSPLDHVEDVEAARLVQVASSALDEVLTKGDVVSGIGGPAADGVSASGCEGPSMRELRLTLRGAGLAGASYFSGPKWLPGYFELLEMLRTGVDQCDMQRFSLLCLNLCTADTPLTAEPPPYALSHRVLQLLAGLSSFSTRPILLSPPASAAIGAADTPVFDIESTYQLFGHAERVKANLLNKTPAEAANSRPHQLTRSEQQLSLVLTQHLSDAILFAPQVNASCRHP